MHYSQCLSLLYSPGFLSYLSSLQILVVGAGGIGCELLKVLSKFTFSQICIIDLDTIEVSNLNRQFLFRKEHKGLSKAEVAKNTLLSMNPSLNISSHQANIKEFGVKFFKSFDVIFSALDNLEARSFLNSMCVTLNKPLLEAGTTGFKGQAMLLKRGISRCYDCEPKSQGKTYQVCTIRTLPEKPLHCVIWAKYLFGVLFGPMDDGNLLEDLREKFENFKENLAEIVFEELFDGQIKKQRDSDPKKFEKMKPLILKTLLFGDDSKFNEELLEEKAEAKQKIFTIPEYIHLFLWAFRKLLELKNSLGFVAFEKDDDLCVKFITAASNLRSHVFSIELLNEFKVKEIAGNIIPAICSTNAIVAAIEVSEALKYMNYLFTESKRMNNKECYVQNDSEKKINAINPLKANPKCLVCNESQVPCLVFVNMESFTLGDFFEKIIGRLNGDFKNLTECILMQQNLLLYEKGDFLEEDEIQAYNKKLSLRFSELFKGFNDIKLTLTLNENQFIKFLIIDDKKFNSSNFSLENDFLQKSCLGDLKEMMMENKMDYEEQLKREENQKKQEIFIKESEGVLEIQEESEEEDLIIEENNQMKTNLKRKRPLENDERLGGNNEKPLKHLKIN